MFLAMSGMFAMFFFNTLYIQQRAGVRAAEGRVRVPAVHGRDHGLGRSRVAVRAEDRRPAGCGRRDGAHRRGLLLLTRIPVDGTYLVDVLPALVLTSLGMGAVFMPLTLVATTGLEDEDQGLASGLFNTSQQIGGALGLAMLSTIAAGRTAAAGGGDDRRPSSRFPLGLRGRRGRSSWPRSS